jgi:hypothetical protein
VTVVFCDPASVASARIGRLIDDRAPSGVFVCSSIALDPDMLARLGGSSRPVSALAGVADAASLRDAVEQLSDLHRGETLVVVAPPELIQGALASSRPSPVVVAIDSDGWVVVE